MTHLRQGFLGLLLLVAMLPSGLLAAPPALAANCTVGTLASPNEEQPYSADYFTVQEAVLPGSHVTVYLGAYGPSGARAPSVSNVNVLDPGFTPIRGLSWYVPATPDCTQPGRTTLYRFRATWDAPNVSGKIYELAVTFKYDDGTLVEYFVNMTVSAMPRRLTGYVHWETTLNGLPQQNGLNYAYNLYDPSGHTTMTAETDFYFQGNPAAQRAAPGSAASSSVVNGGMVDNLNGTGNVFLLPQPEPVPYLAPGAHFASLPFAYTQGTGRGGQPETGTVTVETGHWTFGRVAYAYRVSVVERVTLRAGTSTYIYVGSYVVDNAFSGPIAGAGYGDNLGDGKGFRFYANPAGPTGTADGAGAARLSAYAVNASAPNPDGNTTVSYMVSVFPQGSLRPVQTMTTTGPTADFSGLAPGTYLGSAVAAFRITGAGGQRLTITSDGVPGRPFTIPSAWPTSTPLPPTPTPAQANTPTPVPPTATPSVPQGAATAAVTPGAYAWLRTSRAEDATAQDAFIPTTHHTGNPAHVFWQIGRPLHILPAVSAHDEDVTLTLIDLNRGTQAVLHPLTIHDEWYELTSASPGCAAAPRQQIAYGTSPSYPGEVDPTSSTALTILWVPTQAPGRPPAATLRCALDQVASADGLGTLALSYTVQQRLTFEATFGVAAPLGGCAMVVPTPAPAPPTGGDPPAPPPAFATPGLVPATCDAGDVGLKVAKDALEHLRAIDGAALVGPPVLKRRVDAHGHPVLHVELVVQRPLVLTCTLLLRRTLG